MEISRAPNGAVYKRSRPLTQKLNKIQIDAIKKDDLLEHGDLLPADPYNADHYQLLGVSQDASTEEIHSAYINHARVFHPDKAKVEAARGANPQDRMQMPEGIDATRCVVDGGVAGSVDGWGFRAMGLFRDQCVCLCVCVCDDS